jgi:hypothetical protein
VAGLAAGADAVMVGHLPVAASDGGASRPATLDAGYLEGARAALAAGGVPPLLVADDVTMGALRPPMKQAGVPDPDGLDGGLVDPGLLPAAWLQALVTAGCDLLLIRGIPWRALPAGDNDAAPVAVPGLTAPEGLEALTVEAPAWRAARARLWAVAAAGWADPTLDLGWIDATTGDRWGAADARSGAAFTERLGHLFAAVRHLDGSPAGAGFRPERLLVTSHRPLSLTALAALRPAPSGVAVGMGHPSLAGDLTRFLGAGWRVGQVFDCDVADLEPESAGPVQ